MGVHGLWRLIDASGKPVPLETLEGKVLAIDVSIWIHQVLQGYQDRKGSSVPNAHLLGLFHRICKLLYFKIRPVFVFDGGVPMLKKNTIASRKKQKAIAATKAQQMKNDLLQNLIKHAAVKGALGLESEKQTSSQALNAKAPDMFQLPSIPQKENIEDETFDEIEDSESDDSVELSPRKQSRWKGNIHSVDISSADFKALPADIRYDVLADLKETRKQNSWGRFHEMPKVSDEFSNFQMQRLLKRRKVQESLENAEKEMCGKTMTLEELERLLTEEGIDTRFDKAYRIASNSTTRLIYMNNPKSLENNGEVNSSQETGENSSQPQSSESGISRDFEKLDKREEESLIADINEYDLGSDWDSDDEVIVKKVVKPRPVSCSKHFGKQKLNPALAYMLEYAGLPQEQIYALIEDSKKKTTTIKTEPPDEKISTEANIYDLSEEESDVKEKIDEQKHIKDKESIPIPSLENEQKIEDVCDNMEEKSSDFQKDLPHSNENTSEKIENSVHDKVLISDSDTDSDFIEIQDVPIPEQSNGLEILVKSDSGVQDDLFADVFGKESQTLSDSSFQENLDVSDSSSRLQDSQEISMKDIEIFTPEKSTELKVSAKSPPELQSDSIKKDEQEILNEPQLDKPVEKIAESKSVNPPPVASTSRDNELSEKMSKFKPQLLQANQEKLIAMQAELENEHSDLSQNIGKLERQATSVTDQMRMEAQDLLRLFGIPYVVAPMEAEAQCAYLETIKLTDGTVTDDSDIWLFGGRCVYKNFFNNSKRVLEYRSQDIEHHFKLTRQQMIQLALLVGSDYTVGVPGIGPVTALEILAAFPTEGEDLSRGLISFSSWLKAGRCVGPGRTALRNKLRNVEIENGFPSQAVVQAYLFPTVDESKEGFTWSKPNLTLLADYTRQKFGWTRLKFEETIGPVIKKLAEAKNQKGITAYFNVKVVPKSIETTMSKRVQKAVRRLANCDEEEEAVDQEGLEKQKEKKPRKKRAKVTENDSQNPESGETSKENNEVSATDESESKTVKPGASRIPKLGNGKHVDEYIPQREKDKAIAQKKKLHAIEIFKKSKKGSARGKKVKRPVRVVTKEANLSESSDSS